MHQQPNEDTLQLYHLLDTHNAVVFLTYPSRSPHIESMSSHNPSRHALCNTLHLADTSQLSLGNIRRYLDTRLLSSDSTRPPVGNSVPSLYNNRFARIPR